MIVLLSLIHVSTTWLYYVIPVSSISHVCIPYVKKTRHVVVGCGYVDVNCWVDECCHNQTAV